MFPVKTDLISYFDDKIWCIFECLSNKIHIPIDKFKLYRKNQYLDKSVTTFFERWKTCHCSINVQ